MSARREMQNHIRWMRLLGSFPRFYPFEMRLISVWCPFGGAFRADRQHRLHKYKYCSAYANGLLPRDVSRAGIPAVTIRRDA
jgi:hypothetical protein